MRDALDTKLSNTQMGDKHFCNEMLHRDDDYGVKAINYLEFALSNQRPIIHDKKYIVDNFIFTRFDELSLQDIPKNLFIFLGILKIFTQESTKAKLLFIF
jgi:hypothetical protein